MPSTAVGTVTVNANVQALGVVGVVKVGKPWYASKKVWIAAIGLALAVYSSMTGKSENLVDVLATIAKVASVLGVIAPLILGIAHVDGKQLDLAMAFIQQAKTLGTPDEAPAEISSAAAASSPASPSSPYDVPGLSSSSR